MAMKGAALRVTQAPVESSALALLPGSQMSDAYRLIVDDDGIDAATAAHRIFARVPRWVRALMALRNRLVGPLGLKTRLSGGTAGHRRIGFFALIAEAPDRVLLGLDDKHLDFRIVVDVKPAGTRRRQITTTTLVRTHNRLGRTYLAAVLPLHRLIVPVMLAHAAAVPSPGGRG